MRRSFDVRRLFVFLTACIAAVASGAGAFATPAITMDISSGEVLYQQDATQPWYPASTTKLMTVYVALSAVRDGRIALNTPLVLSARAHHVPPSKMGFPVGTQVTLDNALKMLMVRSANDIAIVVAEGISGSVEAFAEDMNRAGAEIGLRESHFVNPNGLPDADHYSSARDMALIARALYAQFPQDASLFDIGALSLGSEIIGNHNNLLGRYPGVDGMKTGFTCAAGFNVVASAFRDGRRVVVVVFGAPSVPTRTQKVSALLDRAFAGIDRPVGSVLSLASVGGSPVDMHGQVCQGGRAGLIARFNEEVTQLDGPLTGPASGSLGLGALAPERAMLFDTQSVTQGTVPTALTITSMPAPVFTPVPVHIGAEEGYSGVVAQARAPHTPVGSEPEPATVEAYAATPPKIGSPLAVDDSALPLKGRRARLARTAHRGRATLKAAAEAPTTKVIAGADDEEKAAKKSIGDAGDAGKPKLKATAKSKAPAKAAVAKKPRPAKAAAKSPKPPVKTAAKKVKSAASE